MNNSRPRLLSLLLIVLSLVASTGVWAAEQETVLDDPLLQARYLRLAAELRCPQCDNQSILDSNALVSKDLRLELQRLLRSGYSDAAIRQHLRERYGDYILYRPRFAPVTLLLWLMPLLVIAAGVSLRMTRRRAKTASSEAADVAENTHSKQTDGRRISLLLTAMLLLGAIFYWWQGNLEEVLLAEQLSEGITESEIVQLEHYVAANPDSVPFIERLALAYVAEGRFAEARELYRQLSQLAPEREQEFTRLSLLSAYLSDLQQQTSSTPTATTDSSQPLP